MRKLLAFLRRIMWLFRKGPRDANLQDEINAHIDGLVERNVAAGMSPVEARYAAQRQFGNVASVQEQAREQRGWVWLEQWGMDAAFALRSLTKARSFSLMVLGTLVVGIGVATVVFNLAAAILIFSQPYPHPEELYLIGFKDKNHASNPFCAAIQWQAYQEQTDVFSEYAVVMHDTANIAIGGETVGTDLISASIDCFHTLGIKPALGRGFLTEEYRSGANNVVVISNLYWWKYFHGDPAVLGRNLVIGQRTCMVIGVLAAGQQFPPNFDGDVFRPLVFSIDPMRPFELVVYAIGRLKPGVSPEAACASIRTIKLPSLPSWATAFLAGQQQILTRPTDVARPETFWVMTVAALLLYAIACLNVMNLMLVRLLGRRRELTIRLALGGTRWQIMRLLVIESLGLALVASLIVTVAARFLFSPLFAFIMGNEAPLYRSFWDGRTLGCIVVLSLLASIAVVVGPVWRLLKADIYPGLKDGGTAAGEGTSVRRVKTAIVIFQAAFAVILLVGTGLMVRSFERIQKVDFGFQPEGKVKVTIAFPSDYELKPEARSQLFEHLQQRLAEIPGVRAVSFGSDAVLVGDFWGTSQLVMPDGSYQPVTSDYVSADFPKTAGLVIKKGRWFSDKPGVYEVVINESFAKARFGNDDPIGKAFRLHSSDNYDYPVVGVVGDVRESIRSSPGMRFYEPNWAYPQNVDTLLLKLDRDPAKEFASHIRQVIHDFNPKLIASQVKSIHEVADSSMSAERYAFNILRGLSAIALSLAVLGIFSVIAFTVDSRKQEFAVRLALGATQDNLQRLVMKRGVTTAAIGIVVGVAGALALTRFMQSLLFETTPNDPLVYAAVAVVMVVAAVLACWLPARRAAKADPIVALRAE